MGSSATLPAVINPNTSSGPPPGGPARLPSRWVLARVSGPSMSPTVRHGDRLLLPYGVSDAAVRFAVVDLPALVDRLTTVAPGSVSRVNSSA